MGKIVITKKQAEKRIDKFLAKEFFYYSRGEINRKIKNGEVLVNGKNVKSSYALCENDVVELKNFSKEKNNKLVPNKKIKLEILFENENIIIINKPAGMQVHPSANEKLDTVTNALLNYFPKIKNVHDDSADSWMRPGIVHRLDKDTSGVMVVAKNLKTFDELKKLFKSRNISKKYVAICEGSFNEKKGIIEKPIARSSSYRKQVIAGRKTKTKIRPAETQFNVIKEFGGYSLIEAMPKTGRMHQIRLHLASIKHPIVGDLIYGNKKSKTNVKRQLLHAKELKFELFSKKYEFSAPIPDDFEIFSST